MEGSGLLNHYTTLELLKKIKFDTSLWGWRSYINRDYSKVQLFIEQFSKEYNVTCTSVVKYINELWTRFMEEIADIDLLNNESIILSEWKYFKNFDFIIEDLTNVIKIRSYFVDLLTKYSVLFSPNDSQYITYLQRNAWTEINTAMHCKVSLTTHKKAFTRRELKALYSHFSNKQIDTPHLLYGSPEFNIKRYPIFLHVPTAGYYTMKAPFDKLLDIQTEDDEVYYDIGKPVANDTIDRSSDFNSVVVTVASDLQTTETNVISSEDSEKEFVRKNVIDKLNKIESDYMILGILNNCYDKDNCVNSIEIGYILLLSLASLPNVIESKGSVLTGPGSDKIWNCVVEQLKQVGINVGVDEITTVWTCLVNTTKLKLSLYRMYPTVKDYELSDIEMELTYYFNDLVNEPQEDNYGNALIEEMNPTKVRRGCKSKAANNKTGVVKRGKRTMTKEKVTPNTKRLSSNNLNIDANSDIFKCNKTEPEDADGETIRVNNSDGDSCNGSVKEEDTSACVSDNEDDNKPLSEYTAERLANNAKNELQRKIDMLNEIKNFRLKNKYALNKKTANINLPNNHWMNWWKNKPEENLVLSPSQYQNRQKAINGKRRQLTDKPPKKMKYNRKMNKLYKLK